jgi:galactokinase
MASTVRTSTAASHDISAAQRNTMNGYFTAGNTISASHFTYLRDRLNHVLGHTHNVTDHRQIGTSGNTMVNSSSVDTTSGYGSNISLNVSTGTTITASHHNTLRGAAAGLRSHLHSWTDNTS